MKHPPRRRNGFVQRILTRLRSGEGFTTTELVAYIAVLLTVPAVGFPAASTARDNGNWHEISSKLSAVGISVDETDRSSAIKREDDRTSPPFNATITSTGERTTCEVVWVAGVEWDWKFVLSEVVCDNGKKAKL